MYLIYDDKGFFRKATALTEKMIEEAILMNIDIINLEDLTIFIDKDKWKKLPDYEAQNNSAPR